jgi:hypothetical protein
MAEGDCRHCLGQPVIMYQKISVREQVEVASLLARALWSAIADRFAACKLILHPEKTKIVYCKDANRRGDFPNQSFDFLGFTFRARKTIWQGHIPAHGFMPAASPAESDNAAAVAVVVLSEYSPVAPKHGLTNCMHCSIR